METKLNSDGGLKSLGFNRMAFSVTDLEKSIEWYHDVLGFEVTFRTEFFKANAIVAFMQKNNIPLELLQAKSGAFRIDALFENAPNHIRPIGNKLLVLEVDDLHAATLELEEKGVTFEFKEVLHLPGVMSTMIRDIDLNFINIFQKAEGI